MLSSKTATFAAIGALALSAFTLPGCEEKGNGGTPLGSAADRLSSVDRVSSKASRLAEVRDLGNGIFVFPGSPSFAETLSDFREAHQELRIISVTQGPDVIRHPNASNATSGAHSFIVVTDAARPQ